MTDEAIPLSKPDITEAEIEAVAAVLRTDRLSIGPHLEGFETAVATRCGRKYGVGVNSGTSGLHLCVRALGIGDDDEVITTPFTFVATANCVLFERAKPVFVDIDPHSYNMDPGAVEGKITPQTKAILPVEVFGNTAHFDEYERIAEKHDLLLIEDSCEGLGGFLGDRPTGSFGQCSVFGFYPNKQITTGEGGMIVTDSEEIRDLCVSMRNQGRASDAWLNHARLGYNYRMSEMNAVLGEIQMRRLDEILTKRRRAAQLYNEQLGEIEEVHLPPMTVPERASWFVYVIRLDDRFTPDDRDCVMSHLQGEGISCQKYFVPVHLQGYITALLGTKEGDYPVTEGIAGGTIALPFFANMTREQVSRVAMTLKDAISKFA